MIPGFPIPLVGSGIARAYTADTLDAQPWSELGSPAAAVTALITVAPGVTVGATDVTGPAMLIDFYNGSTVNIIVGGKIGAAGGNGGQGDRGRSGAATSTFVGGGGGGGAGTNPGAAGTAADEPDPDDDSEDGQPGTATTGGAGGASDIGTGIPEAAYTPGDQTNRLAFNPAILIWPAFGHIIGVNIWCSGTLTAGGNGGIGGTQPGAPPGDDGQAGEDLPAYYDSSLGGSTDHPVIWYHPGRVVLNVYEGGVYPTMRGRLVASSSLPS